MRGAVGRVLRTMSLAVSLAASAAANGEASLGGGFVIANTVTATYGDTHGTSYASQSNTLALTVASVSAVAVAPKETSVNAGAESFPAGTAVVRTFTITNSGNVADAYKITSVGAGGGSVTSISFVSGNGALTPVTLNTTVSPTIAPGAAISVVISIATTGLAVGTSVPITLGVSSTNVSTSNGVVSDNGRQYALAAQAASIAGPAGPQTVISKLVNQTRSFASNPGQTVTYSIAFRNYGGSAATNVQIVDNVPQGIVALPQTAAINGTSVASQAQLNGQTLTVKVGTLPVNAAMTLTFDAVVAQTMQSGATFVNVANLTADAIPTTPTAPASVLVGVSNIVYDGYDGSKVPVPGAQLTLRDAVTHAIVQLPQSVTAEGAFRTTSDTAAAPGIAPNTANVNPYTTGADGSYSFVFAPSQLGTIASPAQYELDITAANYTNRRIGITLAPDATGMLYNVTLHSLDSQELAVPGSFTLTTSSPNLSDVFGLLGNMPVFSPHALSLTKTVDRTIASGGDRLVYTVAVGSTSEPLGATRLTDTLPAGVVYAPGTARLDGAAAEPVRSGATLVWNLPSLIAQHTLTYACVVEPNMQPGQTAVNTVVATTASTNGQSLQASASADTQIVDGAFGDRIVVTGRVFVDVAKTGRFRKGDRGVPGVHVYLEDGESAITDTYGRYTFPSVRPGEHALRVDASTLPEGVRAFDDRSLSSTYSLHRLLHGIYDAGLMQDVNFAVNGQ